MKKIYLDANIYYNLWLRESKNGIPLDYYANNLIERILKEDFVLVVSDLLIEEVIKKWGFVKELFLSLLAELDCKNKLIKAEITQELRNQIKEKIEFYKIKKSTIHLSDMTHIMLAKQENAIFVTNDKEARDIAIEEYLEVIDVEIFLS